MATAIENIPKQLYLRSIALLIMAVTSARKMLAEHSVVFFAWYYLGIKLALHQEVWVWWLLRHRRACRIAPRDHGKSETISRIVVLWLIIRNRNVRILIATKEGGLGVKLCLQVRGEFESNRKLIADFGLFYDIHRCPLWRQDCFQVIRTSREKDPTLETVGLFGSITGSRFDLIVFDDLIDLRNVTTPEQLRKVEDEVKTTFLSLLSPDGIAWAIGTRKHGMDIYKWMIDNPMWQARIDKAIIREPEDYEIVELTEPIILEDGTEQNWQVVIHGEDRGQVLWPERWPIERLLLRRKELGSIVFRREYQGEVIDEVTALFRLAWLEQCKDESLTYLRGTLDEYTRKEYRVIIAGCDPALVTDKKEAQRQDSSWMVQIAIGLKDNGNRDLLAFDTDRGLSPHEVEKRMEAFYDRIVPYRFLIERNSFGGLYVHNLKERTDKHFIPHHTGANKHDPYEGVPHLSALFESAKFRLPYKTEQDKEITNGLIQQLHMFGSDIHDDQVMALWIAESGILRYLKGQARLRRQNRSTQREVIG
jgi:hypothetical protein